MISKKKVRLWGLGAAIVIALASVACQRTPLDGSAQASADTGPLSAGQIVVTLFSGSQPNGAGTVDLILPDGSKQTANAAPSCTFTALTQSGSYRIQFHDQNAAQPAYTLVSLSATKPVASVGLQVGGAALLVQPAAFQGGGYAFAAGEFHYTVQVTQGLADVQDMQLDIDPASLPSGWSYRFDDPVVRGNIGTHLTVSSATATTPTAVALKVRARVGGVERLSQVLPLQRAWSIDFSSTLISKGSTSPGCTALYRLEVTASGFPMGQDFYLRCTQCVGDFVDRQAGGLLVPAGVTVDVTLAGSGSNCVQQFNPNLINICLDSYCGPLLNL